MGNNFIQIPLSSQRGAALFNSAAQLAQVRDSLALAKSAMENMTDNADWTTVEAAFGLPTGKGQTIYNLIAGTVSTMASDSSIIDLISWLGVTR